MGGFNVYGNEEEHRWVRNVVNWVVQITLVAVLAIFLVQYVGESIKIEGQSMEPSLKSGDTVLIDRLSYVLFKPARFDVVLFRNEDGTSKDYVKRIVGLPGETVQIIDGILHIDGEPLETELFPYISLSGFATNPISLSKNEYFVLGDNMESSEDSRFVNIGNVKRRQIRGKAWFLFSSYNRFGFIK